MITLPPDVSRRRLLAISTLVFFVLALVRLGAVPAFPGAEGFGANASGGRGGTVYHVTNLNDTGTGSFRDAVSVSGRTVVFDVGGIIVANSPVVVKPNITIAGQTAPGEGITLYADRISFSDANNTITRYMRFREGINGDSGTDAVGIASGDKMIFDHVSASWGRDETFSVSGSPSNITLQDCIIGQGLLIHSAGSLMQTSGGVTIFRCLYIDNWMRNPKVKGVNDYQNNVVYNWGSGGGYIPAGDSGGLSFANLIGNYFISGPNTPVGDSPFKTGNLNYSIYHANNLQDLNLNGALDGTAVTDASFPTLNIVPTQFAYPAPATLLTPAKAYAHILANAGASLHRDHADTVMLAELASLGTTGAQISNESEIGGVGTVAGGLAAKDTDGDGMPDWWELAAGTNPLVADNNGDINGDGYTNLENYINAIAVAGVPAATIDGIANDTGSSATDGITSDNTLVFHGTAAPGATVTLSRVDTGVIGTALTNGAGQWTFDYSGTPLADRYYAFTATATSPGGPTSLPTRAFVVLVDSAAAAAPAITSIVTTPSFTINGTSEPGSLVNVTLVGTGIVGTATTNELGNWSAPYGGAPLPPGAYTFTAAAIDLAGNPGAASAPYAINTSLAAPVFTSVTTDSGVATDRITNDTTLILNGTSFNSAVITVTRAGVGVIGTTTASAGGTWSFDYTATTLPAGNQTFTATAASGGSSSPASAPFVVTIDTTRPTISSIHRQNPTTAATTASTLVYRVTFAEPVSGVDATDFSLTLASGVTGTISSLVPVSTSIYDVTVTGATGDGTVRLDLKSSGTGIIDVAANAISGGFTAGQTYTIRLPGSGVWISDETGEHWSTTTDWENGIVANGAGATADFSTRNLDGDVLVQLDSPRTLGRVVFGDSDFSTPALWTLGNNGSPANTLTLVGPTPTLQVDAATTPTGDTADVPAAAAFPSTLDVVLAGSAGFTKVGVGTLQITKPATISGPLTITKGIVQVGPGGSLTPASVNIATSQQLRVAGGTFNTAGDVTWTSGTGTGIIVSAGTGNFKRILPSNTRNSFVRVTGGIFTATEIKFPRSGDSESQALAAGVLISGGDSTVGTIGLGTDNSWGAMTISGGRLTTTGAIHVGFQTSSARGGDVVVSGGEFDSLDASATGGLILARNPITDSPARANNANQIANFTVTGGVSNVARIALGYDATSTAGSAAISLSNGELNVGSGGIVKNATNGMATSITLNSGTLGAMAAWSTTHPIVIAGTPATLALRTANSVGTAFDFTLAGVLSGTGGFAKTGVGILTLSAANTFAGSVAINAGKLLVTGSLASGGEVDVNAGGTLAGSGTINKPVFLNGTLAPDGSVPASALTWNAGGLLAIRLGATGTSDKLVLGGALTKGTAGAYTVALTPGAGFAAGNTYTLANFASSTFNAGDFVATGLPAGFAAAFTLTGTSLQLTIVGTPFITSAGTASGTFGSPFSYTITAGNAPTSFSATGLPAGLNVDAVSGVISGTPTAAGTFHATIRAANLAGTGSAPLTLTIAKATAGVTLGSLKQPYNGTPRSATATTVPAGLNVVFTYDGGSTGPIYPGSYAVIGTIDDPNYTGSASGTLVITITALVRHVPSIHGGIDGSMQVLFGESFVLSGDSFVSGDLLLPGSPAVQANGQASFADIKDGPGSVVPTDYSLTLNSSALVRYIVRRVDPIAMPAVPTPSLPTGTRDVTLNNANQSAGNFATIRNLTVTGKAGTVAIPAGAYGAFTANNGAILVLGVAGAEEPSVYELQSLTLNGSSVVQVVGPVIIRLAGDATLGGSLGSGVNPDWLTVEVASGGLTLGSGATVYGNVVVPQGTVSINNNATLHGNVSADGLSINGSGLLDEVEP